MPDYYISANKCVKCDSASVAPLVGVAVASVGFVYGVHRAVNYPVIQSQRHVVMAGLSLGLIISTSFIFVVFSTVDVVWMGDMKAFFQVMRTLALELDVVIRWGCVAQLSPAAKYAVTLLILPLVMVVLGMVLVGRQLVFGNDFLLRAGLK